MGWLNERTGHRTARAALRQALRELDQVADREFWDEAREDGLLWCETDAYLEADAPVAEAQAGLPWWKQIDITAAWVVRAVAHDPHRSTTDGGC